MILRSLPISQLETLIHLVLVPMVAGYGRRQLIGQEWIVCLTVKFG